MDVFINYSKRDLESAAIVEDTLIAHSFTVDYTDKDTTDVTEMIVNCSVKNNSFLAN